MHEKTVQEIIDIIFINGTNSHEERLNLKGSLHRFSDKKSWRLYIDQTPSKKDTVTVDSITFTFGEDVSQDSLEEAREDLLGKINELPGISAEMDFDTMIIYSVNPIECNDTFTSRLTELKPNDYF